MLVLFGTNACLFFAPHDTTRKARFDVLYVQFILPGSFELSKTMGDIRYLQ